MRFLLLAFVLVFSSLIAEEDNPPQQTKVPTKVHEDAVPSLVNLTALPSAVVNGCVNVITGDLCDTEEDDMVSGPDPYILGHSYCSSSLEEGNLGDGWNFLHYHFLEVCQEGRINFTPKGQEDESIPTLYPIEQFNFLLRHEEPDDGLSPIMSEAPLEDDDGECSEPAVPYLIEKGAGDPGGRDRRARGNEKGGGHHHDKKNIRSRPRYEPLFLFLYEPSGGRLVFKAELDHHHKERSLREFKLETKKSGFTNILGGTISGQTNLKNISISWDKEDDRFNVTLGDGTKRVYERQWKLKEMKKKDRTHAKFYRDYQLHKETKPSGNIVIYDYNDRHEITGIRTYNKDASHKINWVEFEQKSPSAFADHPSLHVKTSDELEHVYYFKKLKGSLRHGTYCVSGIKRQGWP
jgi:hypothetical protein